MKVNGRFDPLLMKKLYIVFGIFFILSCSPGKDEKQPANTANNTATIADTANSAPEITSKMVFKNVVSVKTVVSMPGIKRAVEIILKKKVDKDELRLIGEFIKKDDSTSYDVTFIEYTYEGQQPQPSGTPVWATTHFTPDLNVKILGMSIEDESRLFRDDEKPKGEIIGVWLLEIPSASHQITLYRQNGQLKMETKSPADLSRVSKEVTKDNSSKLPTYNYDNDFGEYYQINSNGDLEQWDTDGLFQVMTKMQ